MKQSRKASLAEALANTLVGFLVATALNLIVLPLYGFDITVAQSMQVTVIFMIASILRSYSLRRVFEWWRHR